MIEDRALDHNLIACFNGLVWVNGLRQNDAVECVSVCVCWRDRVSVCVERQGECVFSVERQGECVFGVERQGECVFGVERQGECVCVCLVWRTVFFVEKQVSECRCVCVC